MQRAGTQWACSCRCCNQTCPFRAYPGPSSSPTERLNRESKHISKQTSLDIIDTLKVLMGTYSWPDRGSYCCSSEPPQQGLSVTDGTTEAFQGPFDCMHHRLFQDRHFQLSVEQQNIKKEQIFIVFSHTGKPMSVNCLMRRFIIQTSSGLLPSLFCESTIKMHNVFK